MPRKRVAQEVLDGVPTIGENHQVVRIVQAKGNHLYEVQLPDGTLTLCRMPPRFRNLVWIKRGDYVVTELHASSTKVTGDITCILYPNQLKHLKETGQWPASFIAVPEPSAAAAASRQEGDRGPGSSEDEDDVFVNVNRRQVVESESESESTAESESASEPENES